MGPIVGVKINHEYLQLLKRKEKASNEDIEYMQEKNPLYFWINIIKELGKTADLEIQKTDMARITVFQQHEQLQESVDELKAEIIKINNKLNDMVKIIKQMSHEVKVQNDPNALQKIFELGEKTFETEEEFLEWADSFDD